MTFVLFLVVNHIVDNKIDAQICLWATILNGSGIRVCYGLCIFIELSLTFHHLLYYIVLILCPPKLVNDNISSGNKVIEVEVF